MPNTLPRPVQAPAALMPLRSELSPRIILLLQIAMALLPMSGFPGPSFMGEIARYASVWFLMPAIGMALLQDRKSTFESRAIVGFGLLFCLVIVATTLVNIPDILSNNLRGRGGLNKFVTSFIVIVYGFCVAWLVSRLQPADLRRVLLKPAMYGTLLAAAVGAVEVAWWYVPAVEPVYSLLVTLTRPGYNHLEFWGRMTSVAFEPHSLGLWLGFAFAVSLWGWSSSRQAGDRANWWLLMLVLNAGMLALSQARGGILVGMLTVAVWMVMRVVRQSAAKQAISQFMLLVMMALLLAVVGTQILAKDYLGGVFADSDNISNLSRYAMNTSAYQMFWDAPLLGRGLGQFAFHTSEYVPSWGWLSYELQTWLIDEGHGWPSTYSLPGRLLSELGIFGFCVWFGGLYMLLRGALKAPAPAEGQPDWRELSLLFAPYMLFYGLPTDTFALASFWVCVGIVSVVAGSRFTARS